MKKCFGVMALVGILAAQKISAGVTINFGIGTMYSSPDQTTPFPNGGLINLLALDSGAWTDVPGGLNALFAGLTSSFTPTGATLVGQIANDNSGGPGIGGGAFTFNYSGNFGAGDQLLIVAYPSLTLGSPSPGSNTTGFFFRTSDIADGSDISYVAPADGATYNLGSYTIGLGGSFSNGQFTSGAGSQAGSSGNVIGGGFTTIPEPTTALLAAFGSLALLRRRRQQ